MVTSSVVVDLSLQWRHNERHGVSNYQHIGCFLSRLSRPRSKKTSKLRVTGLCEWRRPVTAGFPSQRASNTGNVFICWRFNVLSIWQHSLEIHWENRITVLLMMTLVNGNIFRVTGPLWGESTVQRWIPLTKASGAELWCFLWLAHEQTVWFETPSRSLWCHCNVS